MKIPARMAILLLVCGVCVAYCGCHGSQTVWSAAAPSPDGKVIATGQAIAQSGFGTGYIETSVYLNWAHDSRSPTEILELSDFSELGDATKVGMNWLTPTHLELTCRPDQTVVFQAIKWAGGDISLRVASSGATGGVH